MKTKRFLLAAGIFIAMVISCSSSSNGDDDPSSSSGGDLSSSSVEHSSSSEALQSSSSEIAASSSSVNPSSSSSNVPDGTGTGTENDPFTIGSATTLRYAGRGNDNPAGYKEWTLSAHYKLTADITLTSEWTPIGHWNSTSDYAYFNGTFDGNNKTITGIANTNTIEFIQYRGMFVYIDTDGIVKNLALKNVNIKSKGSALGGIAGVNHGTILNSSVTGIVEGNADYVGGVVGLNYGKLSNCHVDGNVENLDSYQGSVGGVAGRNEGTLENCYATGSVEGQSQEGGSGGVVGNNLGKVSNSYAIGNVKGAYLVGGVVGRNQSGVQIAVIENCYATGSVEGENVVGGILGLNGGGTVENCYATGSVKGNTRVGGVAGQHNGTIKNCAALNPSITRSSGSDDNFGRVIGYGSSTPINNHAKNDMQFYSGASLSTFPTSDENDLHGTDVSASIANTTDFWQTTMGWDLNGIWEMTAGNLPKLRGVEEQ
ncbi:MAG: hypothetical protein FWH22_01050 [Fibromonadales bacterium]|nr:hypothetical protein [Fibromonadales bacterium]